MNRNPKHKKNRNMKIGIIAGNRLLPEILAQSIKKQDCTCEVVAICLKGETSPRITKYVDRVYWIEVSHLGSLREVITKENLQTCIMAGQVTPLRIFKRSNWDEELSSLVEKTEDLRPHTIFSRIIEYLEKNGVTFLDSTLYLKEYLPTAGIMNDLSLSEDLTQDIGFGLKMISRFVDLDVGQTIVVKKKSVVALESLEGTDRTILRGYRLAGKGCVVLKFSKPNQDLRFDVPVVGIATLKLLKKNKAAALVLEKGKVIILEKEKFLYLAKKWGIPVLGREKVLF